ncbi:hypothetical protein CspHIS471_0606150 [Cutaneotrichosporon sp. HIS471]|nr:hypothetical protein CspHIS471_0606150 [Cutaneotrichosporon sp. HIS471]
MDQDLIPAGTTVYVPHTLVGTRRLSILKDDDAGWTSTSTPTWINLRFPAPITASRIAITFHGGFVATSIILSAPKKLAKVFPEDMNRRQVFQFPKTEMESLKLEMPGSTDNQGRITVYRIELLE